MADFNKSACSLAGGSKSQFDQDITIENSLKKIKNKLIVMSGKGGVGKTRVPIQVLPSFETHGRWPVFGLTVQK